MASPQPISKGVIGAGDAHRLLLRAIRSKFSGTLVVWRAQETVPDRFFISQGATQRYLGRSDDPKKVLSTLLSEATNAKYALYASDVTGSDAVPFKEKLIPLVFAHANAVPVMREAWTARLEELPRTSDAFKPRSFGLSDDVSKFFESLTNVSKLASVESHGVNAQAHVQLFEWLGVLKFGEPRPSQPVRSEVDFDEVHPLAEAQPPRFGVVPDMPDTLNDGEKERWKLIVSLSETLDSLTHFQLLGCEQKDTAEAFQAAYYERIKLVHPDKIGGALEILRERASALSERFSMALRALSDEKTRLEYIKQVKGGGGTDVADRKMRIILEAAMLFQKAEVFGKHKQYNRALRELTLALSLNPNEADFHALKGAMLLARDGLGGPQDELMISSIDRALSLRETHEGARMTKARVLKLQGEETEAFRIFQTVAENNPKNTDAVREVRLHRMRSGEPNSKRPQLFGGIFSRKKS